LGQSGGAERRHHLVKFELKPVVCIVKFDVRQKKKKKKTLSRELRTESGCSSRVLNVGEAYAVYAVGAVK
jgi:hypothetical protein